MIPPLISFVSFNRLGLVSKNLTALLNTTEDFELYIVDNNSTDGTWDFIQTLNDPRIIEKKRFDINRWVIYGINYVLSHRKAGQYFIHMDDDVYMHTPNFFSKYLEVFDTFPDVGILGAVYNDWLSEVINTPTIDAAIPIQKGPVGYIKVTPVIMGPCMCFRPEVLDTVGYFCEETCGADGEICMRVNLATKWHTGIMHYNDVTIYQPQSLYCKDCLMKDNCKMSVPIGSTPGCIQTYINRRLTLQFLSSIASVKLTKFYSDLKSGKRSVYCASIHDPESIKNHYYNKEWAEENFKYFEVNSN